MKKTTLMLLMVLVTIGLCSFASAGSQTPNSIGDDIMQVCQFSVSPTAGRIINYSGSPARTEGFAISASCPPEKDVRVTVKVYVDDIQIGSGVFTIKAGETSTNPIENSISVSKIYADKDYVLTVE